MQKSLHFDVWQRDVSQYVRIHTIALECFVFFFHFEKLFQFINGSNGFEFILNTLFDILFIQLLSISNSSLSFRSNCDKVINKMEQLTMQLKVCVWKKENSIQIKNSVKIKSFSIESFRAICTGISQAKSVELIQTKSTYCKAMINMGACSIFAVVIFNRILSLRKTSRTIICKCLKVFTQLSTGCQINANKKQSAQ